MISIKYEKYLVCHPNHLKKCVFHKFGLFVGVNVNRQTTKEVRCAKSKNSIKICNKKSEENFHRCKIDFKNVFGSIALSALLWNGSSLPTKAEPLELNQNETFHFDDLKSGSSKSRLLVTSSALPALVSSPEVKEKRQKTLDFQLRCLLATAATIEVPMHRMVFLYIVMYTFIL
mmetsp:Transcript_39836/g.55326  ORF Transcript_39836/g.55326 Transcript_39836/m.55326 type:complete len:174 (-) Transcript_39836:126-647(-)